MKTILVPLDGSDFAARAIPFARAIAQQQGGRIVLVRAVLTGLSDAARQAARGEIQDARDELARVAGNLRENGIAAEWLVPNDEPGWAIIEQVQQQAIDLIVMSTHGRSGLGRWVYGSVADRVLRGTSTPIMLVPPWASFNWPAIASHFRYVVPLDGSAFAQQALGPTIKLARASAGQLILLSAIQPPLIALGSSVAHGAFDTAAATAAAQGELTTVAQRLAVQGVQTTTEVVEGTPTEAILDTVRLRQAHLIVMATHGRGGVTRALLGSVAEATLRRAPIPLLLVRIARAGAEQASGLVQETLAHSAG